MRIKIVLIMIIMAVTVESAFAQPSSGSGKSGGKYKTEVVRKGDIVAFVATTGTLNPATLVEVGSEVSGEITKVSVDFNSPVKKGQVIAELDRTPYEDQVKQNEANVRAAAAALEKAKIDLDTAKKKYDRTLALFEKKLVSEDDKETDESQYLSAKDAVADADAGLKEATAVLDSSRLDLSHTLILSPIDGIVVSRDITVGQTVAARFQAPVLFTIADDLSKLRVSCDVDEAEVSRVKEGQPVQFTVEAFPGETFMGRVIQVRNDAEVDQDVVRYPTIVEVDNARNKLLPGMTATASIFTGEAKNVLRVPNAALDFRPPELSAETREFIKKVNQDMPAGKKASFVWLLEKKDKLTPVVVRTGIAGPDYTEILEGGLKEGQIVITGLRGDGS
jgi:HlyD family secretion protein